MDIGALRVRIIIQKSSTTADKYGNHISSWTDYFPCWATATTSGRQSDETEKAAVTQEKDSVDFTVRYSPEIAAVNSKDAELEVNYTEQSANYSMVREARG